ncbi:MAG: LysR family transcriptional regulator [Thermodesulfobium sp.]
MAQERETTEELEVTPKFRNFDWEKAKTFYYVAKSGSFVNAARLLNISQSALSRQVIYLEQQLGSPLFSRHRDGIKLTRKGEELFLIIERTFIDLQRFTQHTHAKVSNGRKRKIRISSTYAVTAYILTDIIFSYHKNHPDFIFELIGDDHLIDIVLNDVDIAIRPIDSRALNTLEEQGVEQEYLFSLEKKLYASKEYLEKHGEPQTVEDLKHHHIIAFGHPEVHPYADVNWILKLGIPDGKLHEPIFTSNSVECMVAAAKNSIGIVGSYQEMKIIRESNLINILPEVKDKEINDHIIYPKYLKEDKEFINFKNYLKTHLVHTST